MKEFNNEHLSKFLEVENDMVENKVEVIDQKELAELTRGDDIGDDYSFRRKTLHNLVDTGQDALNHMLLVAKESDHPRAFIPVSKTRRL